MAEGDRVLRALAGRAVPERCTFAAGHDVPEALRRGAQPVAARSVAARRAQALARSGRTDGAVQPDDRLPEPARRLVSTPLTLQAAFIGMRQDEARDLLPGSALWNCVDWVPQYLGSPLRKRGGWAYASPAIGGGAGPTNRIDSLSYAPFATGEKFLAVGGDGNAYTYTSGAVSASLGAVLGAPAFGIST